MSRLRRRLHGARGYCEFGNGTTTVHTQIAATVQGFRVAVHTGTGEVRILQLVHSADAGVVLNPAQLRGQIEAGVAQAIGGALIEVYFANTHDALGPFGAKSTSEAPYNPVAPALASAVRCAFGVRPTRLPKAPDRPGALLRDDYD